MLSLFSKQSLAFKSVLLALFLALFFMVLEKQQVEASAKVRSAVHAAMSPIYTVAEKLRFTGSSFGMVLDSKQQLHRENLALKAELAQANLYLQKYAELSAQNARLRGVHDAPAPVDGRLEVAQVIGIDSNPLRQILVINRGKRQGVYVGQTVLDEAGLMGQVINAYSDSSRIMLLSDTQHAISVKVKRTGLRAIAAGSGDSGMLDLRYVPNTADIQVGDKLVSTGLGQRFPVGYAVGEVSFINRAQKGSFTQVQLKPAAKLSDSSYALLLRSAKPIKLTRKIDAQDDVMLNDDMLLEADFAADHQSNTTGEVVVAAKPSGTDNATTN